MIVDDKGTKDSLKEYMEKLMNEENEWDHKISAGVKQGPGDCIRIAEMTAVLKKMKRPKAPIVTAGSRNNTSHRGNWNPVVIKFMQWYCERGCIPEDWKSSVVPWASRLGAAGRAPKTRESRRRKRRRMFCRVVNCN